jgi:chaperonin GroEL
MAAYTNGFVYDVGTIDKVDIEEEDMILGSFDTAKINMYETFISTVSDVHKIDVRVSELKSMSEAAFSEIDRMHFRAAIAKLTGGISTIHVGGSSELEVREKKARVEDAVEAVRSAIAEGVIPGGCIMHLKFAELLKNQLTDKPATIILINALKEPIKLLLNNCGEDWIPVVDRFEKSLALAPEDMFLTVFDANKHEFVNAVEAGIIEPAKVCRVSLGNAISVASLLITLGGIVVVPRDSGMETQLEMSKQAFKDMMASGIGE